MDRNTTFKIGPKLACGYCTKCQIIHYGGWLIISIFWGVHTFIDLMEDFYDTCQFGIKPPLTKRNYKKWSALVIDHLRSEHKEVFTYLCSNELISDTKLQPLVKKLLDIIIMNMIDDPLHVIKKLIHPHDMWMNLWKNMEIPQFLLF